MPLPCVTQECPPSISAIPAADVAYNARRTPRIRAPFPEARQNFTISNFVLPFVARRGSHVACGSLLRPVTCNAPVYDAQESCLRIYRCYPCSISLSAVWHLPPALRL